MSLILPMIEAIVLAGGEGKRLRAVVRDLPKPMANIAGRPFLWWLMTRLSLQGIGRVILSVGYKAEAIQEYFGNEFRGMEVSYSIETEALGTGGGIKLALGYAKQPEVLVLNGDTYTDADLLGLLSAFRSSGTDLAVSVTWLENVARYGAVAIDEETNRLIGFVEKQSSSAGYINAGVYCLGREIFLKFPVADKFSFERDFMPPRLEALKPYAFKGGRAFIDIGVPEDYECAQTLIPAFAESLQPPVGS